MEEIKSFIARFAASIGIFILIPSALPSQSVANNPAPVTAVINVSEQPGNDAAEKLNYSIAISKDGQRLDLSGFVTPQILGSQVNINKSLTIVGCQTTFAEAMPDYGTSPRGGGINISADHVAFQGSGQGKCILTQQNGSNIQTIIQSGAHGWITFSHLTFDGNEGRQTIAGGGFPNYYSCWRASTGVGGGHDLTLEDVELVACGDRAIDWRGTYHNYVFNNHCHQSGIDIAGGGSQTHGDCLHAADVDGPTQPYDTWIVGNLIEEWGDSALACINGIYGCQILNNRAYGQGWYGHPVNAFQGGFDLSGTPGTEVADNLIVDSPTFPVGLTCGTTGASVTPSYSNSFINNIVYVGAASVLGTIPQALFGTHGFDCQGSRYTIAGNAFVNVTPKLQGIVTVDVSDNTSVFTNGSRNAAIYELVQDSSTSVLRDFALRGNSAVVMGAMPRLAINVDSSVTAPAPCLINGNTFPEALRIVTWQRHPGIDCSDGQAAASVRPDRTSPGEGGGAQSNTSAAATLRALVEVAQSTGADLELLMRSQLLKER